MNDVPWWTAEEQETGKQGIAPEWEWQADLIREENRIKNEEIARKLQKK